jgi:uncharacterized protein YndB with AHSA1/START domain
VPEFTLTATTAAPAEEVWKILYDPHRFCEWWDDTVRVDDEADGSVTRYTAAWPDFAYPTRITTRQDGSRVLISCMLSDIVQEWSLEPDGAGCRVRLHVEIPEVETARLPALCDEFARSMPRLVAAAERSAGSL